jgi:hypothetical protein
MESLKGGKQSPFIQPSKSLVDKPSSRFPKWILYKKRIE